MEERAAVVGVLFGLRQQSDPRVARLPAVAEGQWITDVPQSRTCRGCGDP